MTNALLIDPTTETIQHIEINGWQDIAPLIDCNMFTCVSWKGHTIYVDDEGLLVLNDKSKFVQFMGYYQPLAGKCLVIGTDENTGDSKDVAMSIGEVKELVSFHTIAEVASKI